MFERYTERARRVIFFRRHEASQFGSPSIETEHLLLGLLRDETGINDELPAADVLKKEIESITGTRPVFPTSVDLPLSEESKSVLIYAAEEATLLTHHEIGTQHLLLGLMRVEGSLAERLLRKHGITPENSRDKILASIKAVEPQEPARRRCRLWSCSRINCCK